MSKRVVTIECPFKKCDKSLAAEVNADFDNMTDDQVAELEAQVRNQLLPGLKKHHKDGHPK